MGVYRYIRPEGDAAAVTIAAPPGNIVTVETIASRRARLRGLKCSGEDSTNTPMRTRVCRDTVVGTGARTALTAATDEATENPAEHFVVTSYASTQPTNASAGLFLRGWNTNGGGFDYEWAPDRGPQSVGALSLTARQVVGAGTIDLELQVEE